MIRVKSLMQQANPVPETAPEEPARPSERRRMRRRGLVLSGSVAALAVAVAAVVTLVTVFGSPGGGSGGRPAEPPAADEPYYVTTGDLERHADVVVRARVVATRETDEDGFAETIATVSVVATGKGKPPGRTIHASYPSPGAALPSGPELTVRHEYVLLLARMDDGKYVLVNTTQGYYGIEAGHAKAGPDNDVALSDGVLKALGLTPLRLTR
ncbi:hypothetical protein SBI_03846 [Streptomyces bingchenggensis BCW-1]|uniref:Uncharacterized protein n=2 Tax=Streptomyces TaxID=1883 RepID=D7CHB0_STRBB|nr:MULTISPECIES: hypothetical protein [Streptomyces]ADI06967.1 hypothetical protein SBI_03846 [Streptomyces bingchenggensis BCW-1]